MIVRPVSFLPARDFKIHEAAHFCVGSILGLPMGQPEVFNDGTGGIAPFDKASMEQSAAGVELKDFPADTLKRGATQIAATFLAGHAAEGIAGRVDLSCIIGERTEDWINARDIVRKAGQSELLLQDAWRLSVRILFKIWPLVIDVAKDIPSTDNTHKTFEFQASANASATTPRGALASGKPKPGGCTFPAPMPPSEAGMKAAILELIKKRQDVSFAELARDVPGFAASDPAESLELGTDKRGVILWAGLSRPAFNAMRALQTEGRIRARSSGVLPYLIDGITLSLKVAKPGRSYKRCRWLPVTWRTT